MKWEVKRWVRREVRRTEIEGREVMRVRVNRVVIRLIPPFTKQPGVVPDMVGKEPVDFFNLFFIMQHLTP